MNNASISKKYDSCDMGDVHSQAKADLTWMITALNHVSEEVRKLAKESEEAGAGRVQFEKLLTHLSMYEYLAEDMQERHENYADKYYAAWEKDKAVA